MNLLCEVLRKARKNIPVLVYNVDHQQSRYGLLFVRPYLFYGTTSNDAIYIDNNNIDEMSNV